MAYGSTRTTKKANCVSCVLVGRSLTADAYNVKVKYHSCVAGSAALSARCPPSMRRPTGSRSFSPRSRASSMRKAPLGYSLRIESPGGCGKTRATTLRCPGHYLSLRCVAGFKARAAIASNFSRCYTTWLSTRLSQCAARVARNSQSSCRVPFKSPKIALTMVGASVQLYDEKDVNGTLPLASHVQPAGKEGAR